MRRIGILAMVVLITSSCLMAQVRSDYDKSADFSKYKTYSFAGWQKDSEKVLNDLDKQRIYDAFKSEFSARGLELVENGGDMLMTLFVVIDNKTSKSAYTDYHSNYGMGMGVGMGPGMGVGMGAMYGPSWGWGNGSATTNFVESDYQEGTLVVDALDGESKKLVWQGTLQSVVNDKPEKRDSAIPKKIGKLMKKFPKTE